MCLVRRVLHIRCVYLSLSLMRGDARGAYIMMGAVIDDDDAARAIGHGMMPDGHGHAHMIQVMMLMHRQLNHRASYRSWRIYR